MTQRACTFAFALIAGCSSGPVVDDAGSSDAGTPEAGTNGSAVDAGPLDAGSGDAGTNPPPPASITILEPTAANALHPLDDVVLQGSPCPDPTGHTLPTCWWWFKERPENSTAEFTNAFVATTQLSFHSAAGVVTGVDVAGHYVFGFTVIYPDGSSTEAALSLDVVPWPGLAVELTWALSNGDVDLWLMKDSTDGCAPETCISGPCQVSPTSTPPEWDGVAGFTDGDPAFAIADLSGYGPEHLRVVEPTDGVYRVGAFASGTYADGVPTTVRVFMDGETVHASTIALSHHDWAEFAAFTIADGVVVDMASIGDVTPAWSCP